MKKIILIFISLIILLSLDIFSREQNTWSKRGYRYWSFRVQPYRQTKIFINNKRVYPRFIKRNNTIATYRLNLKKYSSKKNFKLTLKKKGYTNYSIRIRTSNSYHMNQSFPPLFVMPKTHSKMKCIAVYKTGKEPKNAQFIDKNRIILPLLADKGADVLNIKTGKRVRLTPPRRYSKHWGYVEAIVIKDRDEIWFSEMTNGSVHIYNRTTLSYIKTIKTTGKWSKVLLYNPIDKHVYLSHWISKNVSKIDPVTRKEVAKFKVFGTPRGMTFSPDYKYLYVAQFGYKKENDMRGGTVKIRMKDFRFIKRFGKPGSKRHLVYSPKRKLIFLSDMSRARIEVYKADNEKLIKEIYVYSKPNTIVLSPDERYLFVSCRGPNSRKGYRFRSRYMGRVYMIDTKTLKIIEFIEGGNQPTGLDISKDGRFLVSTDFLDHSVRVIKIRE